MNNPGDDYNLYNVNAFLMLYVFYIKVTFENFREGSQGTLPKVQDLYLKPTGYSIFPWYMPTSVVRLPLNIDRSIHRPSVEYRISQE